MTDTKLYPNLIISCLSSQVNKNKKSLEIIKSKDSTFLKWRSERDSNSRTAKPPNDLANRPLQPLEYRSMI